MSETTERSSNIFQECKWVAILIFRCFCWILSIAKNNVDRSVIDTAMAASIYYFHPGLHTRECVYSISNLFPPCLAGQAGRQVF